MTKGRSAAAAAGRDAIVQATPAYPACSTSSSTNCVQSRSPATSETPSDHTAISTHRVEERVRGSDRQGSHEDAGLNSSRPASIFGKPEDDICFPTEARSALAATRLASKPKSTGHDERTSDVFADSHQAVQLPGILPGFPFPFDFTALDNVATQKSAPELGIHGDHVESGDGSLPSSWATSSVTFGTGPPGFEAHDRARPVSSRGKEGSYHGGASLRKLAAFEAESGVYHGVPSEDVKESQCRFSFYSNSTSSTIHARTLADLPRYGETFAELFCGRAAPSGLDGQQDESRSADLEAKRAQVATSGAATPRSDKDVAANVWWLDVTCPTPHELKTLSKVFGIHPLTTEDIQMEETREKIELFRNYYFVCFRSFDQDPYSATYLEPLNMYMVVFREGILSNVRRRIKQLRDYIKVTPDWISYALIDAITDAFGPLIKAIEYEVDAVDEAVLVLKVCAGRTDMLRQIGDCRRKVIGLLRLLGNKVDVVKGLSKRCNEEWSVAPKSDIGLYLSDIQDHIVTCTQSLTHYEKILSRSHSNYLAQVSIEMSVANNQINRVLNKLTALGTVLIPLNLVTGLWGMNVIVPGQDAPGLNWFFGILGCLITVALGGTYLVYRFFIKQR
ncbi:hypothetical protein JCM3774_000923 [Rhodotorula dairenensis]